MTSSVFLSRHYFTHIFFFEPFLPPFVKRLFLPTAMMARFVEKEVAKAFWEFGSHTCSVRNDYGTQTNMFAQYLFADTRIIKIAL